jgi:mRNA turnover protein 4
MPKSKRNKVISLTKVKKKPREEKDKLIDKIRTNCEKLQRVFLVSLENERTSFIQEIRKRLRPSELVCAKNKVMQLALGTTPAQECQDGVHKIAERISGPCALLFTNKTPVEVQTVFQEYRPSDYARSGATATETVTLKKGVDALARLPHSIEAHLRQLGLPTQLKEGVIHLLGDHTVCKKGQEISSDAAQLLKLLEIKQAQFLMTVEAHWTKGGEFQDCDVMED